MFSDQFVRRQRLSALANGVLIGSGLLIIALGGILGAVSVLVGIGLEVWQRKRLPQGRL